ncbi:DUF3888 domain-containing protein [Clostridium sp. DJ247]|uniref:DUF3888 domain-containing protein n=1 Tax=Clostridium sp. DJ247 TaxID=2726188 RepID=UPI001F4D2A66|nr:DUF3888 domain-containing protein [Clostridium sp. DJ247]
MKKIVFVVSILIVITSFSIPCSAYELTIKQPSKIEQAQLTENSKEIIYIDLVISLLVPYMQKEINNYYKEYLTELPIIFPYSVDIVNVERQGGSGYIPLS